MDESEKELVELLRTKYKNEWEGQKIKDVSFKNGKVAGKLIIICGEKEKILFSGNVSVLMGKLNTK